MPKPVIGPVTQKFGASGAQVGDWTESFNKGWDFAVAEGTSVNATVAGRVIAAGYQKDGWGISVKVQDAQGRIHNYGHLSSVNVEVGQDVSTGANVGESGNTGLSTGPHLSYDVYDTASGQWIDPTPILEAESFNKGWDLVSDFVSDFVSEGDTNMPNGGTPGLPTGLDGAASPGKWKIGVIAILDDGTKVYGVVGPDGSSDIFQVKPGQTVSSALKPVYGPNGQVFGFVNPLTGSEYTPQEVDQLTRTGALQPPPPAPFEVWKAKKSIYDAQVNEKVITRQQELELLKLDSDQAEEDFDRWEAQQASAFNQSEAAELRRQFQEVETRQRANLTGQRDVDIANLGLGTAVEERLRAGMVGQRDVDIANLGLDKQQEQTARGRITAQDLLPYFLPGATGMDVLGTHVNFPQIDINKFFGPGLDEVNLGPLNMPEFNQPSLGPLNMPGVSEPSPLSTITEPPPAFRRLPIEPIQSPEMPNLDDILAQYAQTSGGNPYAALLSGATGGGGGGGGGVGGYPGDILSLTGENPYQAAGGATSDNRRTIIPTPQREGMLTALPRTTPPSYFRQLAELMNLLRQQAFGFIG